MEIVNHIKYDIAKRGVSPVIDAVQGEENSRVIELSLFANGSAFDVSVSVCSLAFKKPDGTSGWYDTLPDGSSAYSATENVVSIKIAPQVLTVAGKVDAVIRIETADNTDRATTFPIIISVSADPAIDAPKSENYYQVQNWDDVNAKFVEIEKLMAESGNAIIDDDIISKKTVWSSKNTVDKLCPAFTESGSAVTCEPIEGYPLEVVSYINPIQEGSGEPSPGGVNLIAGVAYKTAGNWSVQTVDEKDAYVYELGDDFTTGQYCFSGNSGYNVHLARYNEYSGEISTLTGGQGTFREVCEAEFYEDWDYNRLLLVFFKEDVASLQDALDVLDDLKLERGTGANIRPISPTREVKLWHGGKNLFDEVAFYASNGFEKQADGHWRFNPLTALMYENTAGLQGQFTVSLHGYPDDTAYNGVIIKCEYADGTINYYSVRNDNRLVYTTDASKVVSGIYLTQNCGFTVDHYSYVKDIQIEYGATATEYEPYRGGTVTFDLGQDVYGGSLNWATGELVIDWGKTAFSGVLAEGWRRYSNGTNQYDTFDNTSCFFVYVPKAIGLANISCNMFHNDGKNTAFIAASAINGLMCGHNKQNSIYFAWGNVGQTLEDWKAFLAEQYGRGTPVEVVYQLAEPITVQLTPQEILAVSGTNTIYSDTGDTTVTGRADPTAIIDKLTKAILSLGGNV